MKEQGNAVNTFKDGLLMDTNPLSNDGTSLTNALNATLTTNNGNELMLQNDMGNGRINKVRLDEGYIPVGMKEHGGVIYIASYNPETKKGQIGSFPYPKVEYDNNDFINEATQLDYIYGQGTFDSESICDNNNITFHLITHNSLKIKLFVTTNDNNEEVLAKFKQGDWFSLILDSETSKYLMADNIEASIVSKTASDYATLYTISKKELSENGTEISLIYNYPYSGTLFLLISLNVPDTFDISYKYDNGNFIIYPYAYKSDNPLINTTMADIFKLYNNKTNHILNNFNCGSPIILENDGIYHLCPITSDKGYLDYLTLKLILDSSKSNHIFKYTFNEGLLDLYWDIFSNDSSHLGGNDKSYKFTYNFYPLENASSVRTLEALLQLTPTQQIIKEGYPSVSGVRNIKCNLLPDTIYILLITVAIKELDTYSNEEACFGGFIYGTSRYNEMFDTYDNFNDIEENDQTVNYTFDRQLLELNRVSITNKHLLYNEITHLDEWQEAQGVILLNESLIPTSNIPKAYSSEVAVKITKTEESIVVAPNQDIKFIYDSDLFSIESSKFNVNFNDSDTKIYDVPQVNKSTRIITSYNPNDYRIVDKDLDSITFYRYISSESSDGLVQQTRTFKLLMPIFNPNMLNYEELFGFDFSSNSVTGVFGSKNYLNMTEAIKLTISNAGNGKNLGTANRLIGNSEGNSSPGIIKLFLLMHSKDYRGQDISSIFDLFGGAQGPQDKGDIDEASLRLENGNYMPLKVFSGLDPGCAFKEFADDAKYIIPSCLTYTNQALLLPLPSSTIGACYTRNYKTEEEGKYEDRSKYPENDIYPAHSINPNNYKNGERIKDLLVPAFKKLFCLLSQIFTLLEQESYVYIVGPSEVTINYNIQDDSYVEYTSTLNNNDIFIDEGIHENLNNVKDYLSISDITVVPNNYIGRLKLKESLSNYFFYGRNVNMDSTLYNNILSQYINSYDESVVIDNSSGYSTNDIYYLDSYKLWKHYEHLGGNYSGSINDFRYDLAHSRILNSNYPMDGDNDGILVIDGDYNKIWSDYDIYYNPSYNCYQYDLTKTNFIPLLTKSTLSSNNYLLDWAGNCWIIPSLVNSFMTVEEAKSTAGSLIASYSNNFIVLRTLNTISSTWVHNDGFLGMGTGDKPGPVFAKIDLGFRGHNQDYIHTHISSTFLERITEKILNIVNLYNHNLVAIAGRYLDEQTTPTTPYTP